MCFVEVCVYQVKPERAEEFEGLVQEVAHGKATASGLERFYKGFRRCQGERLE
jgi:hypothetical protein